MGPAERLHALHRSLHALHDRVVADPAAPALAAALGRMLDAALAAAPPEAWDDQRAVSALVARALSGGSAAALDPALEAAGDRVPPKLGKAVALHLDRSPRAATALKAALPDMPPDALALAELALGSLAADPDERVRHLHRAMTLMPGTLVEEAAARRRLAFPPGNAAEATEWARTALAHLHRFPRSPHREAVLVTIARGLPVRAAHVAPVTVEALLDAAPALAEPLAREAVLSGDQTVAELALARSDDVRTADYRAAIRVISDTDESVAAGPSPPLDPPEDATDATPDPALGLARKALAAAIARPPALPPSAARAHPMDGEAIDAPVLDGLDDALAAARMALERAR